MLEIHKLDLRMLNILYQHVVVTKVPNKHSVPGDKHGRVILQNTLDALRCKLHLTQNEFILQQVI